MFSITLAVAMCFQAVSGTSFKPDQALLISMEPAPAHSLDPFLATTVHEGFSRPMEGQSITGVNGDTVSWQAVAPDPYGRIEAPAGSWLAYRADDLPAGQALMTCSGHDLAIVNGASHAGMTGSPGVHKMPITLHSGQNDIFVRSSGGPVTLQVEPLEGDELVFVSSYDITLPHVLDLEPVDEVGAVLVINASDEPLVGLDIATYCRFVPDSKLIPRLYPALPETQWHVEPMASVPAKSIRKVPFRIVGPPPFKKAGSPYPVDIEIRDGDGQRVAHNVVNLATRYPTDRIRHTWKSELDGSIQSCIIVPPDTKESTDTLRGLLVALPASVKSPHGMARAYHPKDDRYVCVPWSRRTGVTGTALGRADALEAIELANQKYEIDSSRQWVSGFSDAGLAAWKLAMMYPDRFTAVIPVATDLPADVPLDGAAGLHVMLRWGANDPSMPGDAAERLGRVLEGVAASVSIEVVPDEGHWWGRETVASESINAFLARTEVAPAVARAPAESPGFDRLLERPLTLVYGTQGTRDETRALHAKARFDQEQLWAKANTGANVVPDTQFDPMADPCSNVVLYGNADTHALWSTLTGTAPFVVTRTGSKQDGSSMAAGEAVIVAVHPSPSCSTALVGVVAPTGEAAHRLLVALPVVMQPGAMLQEHTTFEAIEAARRSQQLTHAD